jgi:hypothetical protein
MCQNSGILLVGLDYLLKVNSTLLFCCFLKSCFGNHYYRIRGAYLVKPFLENEVLEKTKRKGSLAEEAALIASSMSRTLASALAQKAPPPSKQGKSEPKAKVCKG